MPPCMTRWYKLLNRVVCPVLDVAQSPRVFFACSSCSLVRVGCTRCSTIYLRMSLFYLNIGLGLAVALLIQRWVSAYRVYKVWLCPM